MIPRRDVSALRPLRRLLGAVALASVATSPGAAQSPPSLAWRSLSAGGDHSCGLGADSLVYCWGANDYGQLGDGTRSSRYIPVRVAARAGLRFAAVAAGGENSCALGADGAAWCWGDNRNGQVGDRSRVTRRAPVAVTGRLRFRSIELPDVPRAVGENGTTYLWGEGYAAPTAVPDSDRVERTSFGGRPCAVAADGAAVCWELGDSVRTARVVPGGLRFASIYGWGGETVCGLTSEGAAYCWGSFVPGRPENAVPRGREAEPFPVAPALRFRSLHPSFRSVGGLSLEGIPYCWGRGGHLIPGVPEQEVTHAPVRVPVERALVSLTVGRLHACGLTQDGTAYCWGLNSSGQLGDGTGADRRGAVRVAEPAAPGATAIPGPPVVAARSVSRLLLPANHDPTRRLPVIVFLPPVLGPETRPMGRYTSVASDYAVVLPTDTLQRDDFADAEEPGEVYERFERGVLADLTLLAATNPLDTTRVVLAGFSGGGDMAWQLVTRHPTRFAGAIVMGSRASFRGPPESLQALALRRVRFVFAVGDGESAGMHSALRAVAALLQRHGIEHRLETIPDGDHVPAPAAMFSQALAFVLGQK